MATVNERVATSTQTKTDIDLADIFVKIGEVELGGITSATAVDLAKGTMISRIPTTGKFAIMKSASEDGTQYPVGVLAEDVSLEAATEKNINVVKSGIVDASGLVFNGADTIASVVDSRQYLDLIPSMTVGIELVSIDQLTNFDN